MKITWSPLALERVQGIARYIAKDKPSAAEKWVKELFELSEGDRNEAWTAGEFWLLPILVVTQRRL